MPFQCNGSGYVRVRLVAFDETEAKLDGITHRPNNGDTHPTTRQAVVETPSVIVSCKEL
jgi:hypothetical protein